MVVGGGAGRQEEGRRGKKGRKGVPRGLLTKSREELRQERMIRVGRETACSFHTPIHTRISSHTQIRLKLKGNLNIFQTIGERIQKKERKRR